MATAIHQTEDKLLGFAYGELPAPESSAVESHLESCARCTQALDQIQSVRMMMSALPQEPAPAQGLESLLAYADQAAARYAAPKSTRGRLTRWVASFAGACALALVAVVAVKTGEEVDLSAEKAVLDAQPRKDGRTLDPSLVASAPAQAPGAGEGKSESKLPEPKKSAEKLKAAGKTGGVGAESDRKSMEARPWGTANKKQDVLLKNSDDDYAKSLEDTKSPATERQLEESGGLGTALSAAQKEAKSRREAPNPSLDSDFGNARGGYVQGKKAEEQKIALAKPSAPPAAAAAPQAQPSSLGLSMGGSGSRSNAGLSASADKAVPSSRGDLDEQSDGRKGGNKDIESVQRDQEQVARGYLDSARSAANQGNRQEEVKQALAVLQTQVKGAPRAEALNRLCSALEVLGNPGQADRYCDALLLEFPNTAAAQQIATRRNNVQRSAPAAKRSRMESESPADIPAQPAKVKPAEAKPAATTY